ncbi:MAG: alpha/beta fold hydrolase [Rhodospirillaceae bacterium]
MLTRRMMIGGTAVTTAPVSPYLASTTAARVSKKPEGVEHMEINRAFVRIEEGLIHYRHSGNSKQGGPLPLYMMHAGPGSSRGLESLVSILGDSRQAIAADTLGFGDSVPPATDKPDLLYYADSVIRIWDALGLDKVDVYGSHTGANIGMEIAITHPDRVNKLVFDGVALFDPDLAADMLENYAPEMEPMDNGEHFIWAWNFIKDMGLYFPHYKRDAKHYLGKEPWSPAVLHNLVLDVMKALPHYHKGYNAVFRHKTHDRLPLVMVPTFCMAHEADPLHVSVEEAAALVPNSQHLVLPFSAREEERAEAIIKFLDT